MRAVSLQILCCLGLLGCSSWPDAGQGGGEVGGIIAEPTYLSALADTQQAGLLAQSEVLDAHVELLVLQGAVRCVPAAVLQLQQQGLTVRRALAAGLLADALDDLAVYQHLMRQVRVRFTAVKTKTQCAQVPQQSDVVATASSQPLSVFTLLFDLNSAEIGPGYQQHLQLLADLLKSCDCQLFVIGHTDLQGEEAANLQLSERRVAAVQQALASLGVNAGIRQAVGEQTPLLRDAAGQALNRRVELWLQAKSHTESQSNPATLLIKQWQDAGVLPSSAQ